MRSGFSSHVTDFFLQTAAARPILLPTLPRTQQSHTALALPASSPLLSPRPLHCDRNKRRRAAAAASGGRGELLRDKSAHPYRYLVREGVPWAFKNVFCCKGGLILVFREIRVVLQLASHLQLLFNVLTFVAESRFGFRSDSVITPPSRPTVPQMGNTATDERCEHRPRTHTRSRPEFFMVIKLEP
jgi:hypothetical protein